MKHYSLRKSRKIHTLVSEREEKKRGKLTNPQQKEIEKTLNELSHALKEKDKEQASLHAKEAELFYEKHYKKTPLEWFGEFTIAITIALVAAVIIRLMWFELYEIPTGSMRPTYKESDRLAVTKTQFGINIPLLTKHFYFDPDLVKRTGVIIFTADGLPKTDTDTRYFYIFPSKKRFVKRLLGKPGDSLYFYGGKIYGVDKDGNPIDELLNAPWMETIDNIPFITFWGGEPEFTNEGIEISQYNMPVGRIAFTPMGKPTGKIFNGKQWIDDKPTAKPHDSIQTYSDLFGMKNFATAKIIENEGKHLLELTHTPSLKDPKFQGQNLALNLQTTTLPLDKVHLKRILDNLVTERFTVVKGKAHSWGHRLSTYSPDFPGIPDGTYEFDKGKAYWIDFTGWRHPLPADHPLYNQSPENIVRLYNFGVVFHKLAAYLYRYSYFRDGDLYLMGAPIFKKGEPVLEKFVEAEKKKELPFIDWGKPESLEMITTFGLKIPEKSYLMLGDNYPVSQDSRVFGFVPEQNIEGRPSINLWPPGNRWGFIMQSPYEIFVLPRLLIWAIVLGALCIWYVLFRKK